MYKMDKEDVLNKLGSSVCGLSSKEARRRLLSNGKNVLKEEKKKSLVRRFLSEFNDVMTIVLLIASVLSFVLSYVNNDSYVDSIVIVVIVLVNALLSFVQELKSDKALDNLKKMQSVKTKVKRDGKAVVIDSCDVVVGDILILEAGDMVVADARVIVSYSLKCDEASLTGESLACAKDNLKIDKECSLQDRSNMVFSGTNVVYGKGLAVVCACGMDTEFGLIAKGLELQDKEVTPLEKKMRDVSAFLAKVVLVVVGVVIVLALINGMDFKEVLMLSISFAVAAIPEGLPTVITITLSLGVLSMARKKAIVRKLSSVETLGCTEVICTDKTGTITSNKMVVDKVYYDGRLYGSDEDIDDKILEIMGINNDVEYNDGDYVGEATEIAMYKYVSSLTNMDSICNKYVRIGEIPFDSVRKMMSVLVKGNDGIVLFTKGSFDSVIDRCSKIYVNNKSIKLTKNMKSKLKEVEKELSGCAYRVLSLAYKDMDFSFDIDNVVEDELIFVGMVCMIDPPREDVRDAIISCKEAGIKSVMITGDSLDTALAIAKDVGILVSDKEAILGSELDKLSDCELSKVVGNYSCYARVSPMNKLSIVNAFKENGVVVAMTGDGVNDAPSLKAADIGIGMGITGTEVSKSVSDVVIVDDSFSTIVDAVKEGRRIFNNIRNVLVYLLAGNICEIMIVFIGMLFGVEIYTPIQLLYINLITDTIPAVALAFEEADDSVMKKSARKKDGSFFTPFCLNKIFISSIIKTITILLIYVVDNFLYGASSASTMAFLSLVLFEMMFAFSCKDITKSVINKRIFKNRYLNISMLVLLVIQIIVFVTPFGHILNIGTLTWLQVLYAVLIVLFGFLIDEILKKYIVMIFKDY